MANVLDKMNNSLDDIGEPRDDLEDDKKGMVISFKGKDGKDSTYRLTKEQTLMLMKKLSSQQSPETPGL